MWTTAMMWKRWRRHWCSRRLSDKRWPVEMAVVDMEMELGGRTGVDAARVTEEVGAPLRRALGWA